VRVCVCRVCVCRIMAIRTNESSHARTSHVMHGQVACSRACVFCATGRTGFVRQLSRTGREMHSRVISRTLQSVATECVFLAQQTERCSCGILTNGSRPALMSHVTHAQSSLLQLQSMSHKYACMSHELCVQTTHTYTCMSHELRVQMSHKYICMRHELCVQISQSLISRVTHSQVGCNCSCVTLEETHVHMHASRTPRTNDSLANESCHAQSSHLQPQLRYTR